MGLADEGEGNKEHCHQGEWLKKVGGNDDQRGQTQPSPNPSHVQADAGCIRGLHMSNGVDLTNLLVTVGQFDQLIGDHHLYQPCQHVGLVPLVILDPIQQQIHQLSPLLHLVPQKTPNLF